jgi:hypothetical protein
MAKQSTKIARANVPAKGNVVALNPDMVTVTMTITPKEGKDEKGRSVNVTTANKEMQHKVVLDFSKLTREHLIALATKPVVITLQGRARMAATLDSNKGSTFEDVVNTVIPRNVDVLNDVVNKARSTKPVDQEKTFTKATRDVSKLSPEKRAELLKMLQSMK